MKKILSTMLALALCAALAVPAFAAGETYTHMVESLMGLYDLEAAYETEKTISFENRDYVCPLLVLRPGSKVSTVCSLNPYVKDESGVYCSVEVEGIHWPEGPFVAEDWFSAALWGTAADMVELNFVLDRRVFTVFAILGDAAAPTEPAPVEPAPAPAETTKPAETKPAPVPAGPGAYTVKKGDTLGQIGVNFYGSYGFSDAIYKANAEAIKASNGKLTPGMVLNLPDAIGKAVRMAPAAAAAGETLYTVKLGDTLGKIAANTYGDMSKYKAIFERNADRLTNANLIYEGQIIVLPAK